MRRAALALLVALVIPSSARAFTIQSAFSDPCHEMITLEALERLDPPELDADGSEDAVWRRLAAGMRRDLERDELDDAVFLAGALGVRAPDLRTAPPTDFDELRHVHLPDENQPDHFLRRSFDDFEAGDVDAVAAGRARLEGLLAQAAMAYARDPRGENLVEVTIWVENYGQIAVEVWEPLFLLAQAAHLLQDSFSHTYRSDDATRIQVVQNYGEAVEGHYVEERDGPRHSSALDACMDTESRPLMDAATDATEQLFDAAFDAWAGDPDRTAEVLDRWMSLDDACRSAGDCVSPFTEHARTGETSSPFACGVARGEGRPLVFGLFALALLGLRRRRHRR